MTEMPMPRFKPFLRGVVKGERIIPLIRDALWEGKYKSMTIQLDPPDLSRRVPDGWHHPSTHPRWPERMLWFYHQASALIPEPMDPHSNMAVTQGTFWHEFIGNVGIDTGIFLDKEVHVRDEATRAKGNFDWLLDGGEIGEFKTIRSSKMNLFPDVAPEEDELADDFMERMPGYYAQAQEYMRLSKRDRWRAVFMALEYPFPMREIALRYDPAFGAKIRDKYLRVLDAVADSQMPPPCCNPGSAQAKVCPARAVCPVGLAS